MHVCHSCSKLHILCSLSRHLTANPHIAGSEENHMLAQYVYNEWSGFKFDNVQLMNYSVLLSYPNTSNPNVLQLMRGSEVFYEAHIKQEPPHTPGENDSRVAPPFNAYAGSGSASVRLHCMYLCVFVGYCSSNHYIMCVYCER